MTDYDGQFIYSHRLGRLCTELSGLTYVARLEVEELAGRDQVSISGEGYASEEGVTTGFLVPFDETIPRPRELEMEGPLVLEAFRPPVENGEVAKGGRALEVLELVAERLRLRDGERVREVAAALSMTDRYAGYKGDVAVLLSACRRGAALNRFAEARVEEFRTYLHNICEGDPYGDPERDRDLLKERFAELFPRTDRATIGNETEEEDGE